MTDDVLVVRDLRVYYHTPNGAVKAVDGVGFTLRRGERFGPVGESGSGKSTTAWSIMRLIKPPGQIEGGSIRLGDLALSELSEEEIRRVRLAQIALIPQGAMNSLNPVMRIRSQILDGVASHRGGTTNDIADRLPEILGTVGLLPSVLELYPHELSGGQRQRLTIARALLLPPTPDHCR